MKQSILAHPPGAGVCRICPHCGRWFVLQRVETKNDPIAVQLQVYRCRTCGKETTFARGPPGRCV